MNENFTAITYASYAVVAVALTIALARILFRNGDVFLNDVFPNNTQLSRAINRLLVVGFYLVNLGYACITLKSDHAVSVVNAVEILAGKLGILLLSLAGAHFFNLYVLHRVRRSALDERPRPFLGQT